MPEGNINAEVAKGTCASTAGTRKARSASPAGAASRSSRILEAFLLAIVALATALSGYQAALFDGESARQYATSSRLRSESVEKHLEANQNTAVYDANTLNSWLQADVAGDEELKAVLEKRFTDSYRAAFEEWIALDPMINPEAPPGPRFMPGYEDPVAEEGSALADEARMRSTSGCRHARPVRVRPRDRAPGRDPVPHRHRPAVQASEGSGTP